MSKNWESEVPEVPESQGTYELKHTQQGIHMYHVIDEWAKDKVTACKKRAQAMTPIIAISALIAALLAVIISKHKC